MQEDLLARIENGMESFSKSQKRIAKFILESYEKAAYMTALKLGSAVGVSESTVVRFAIELGYEGYPELQRSLQSLIKNRLTSLQRIDITNDRLGEGGALRTVLLQDIDRIKHTMEEIDEEKFNEAIEKISSARRIYILGAMSAGALAKFLHHNLSLIFDNVIFVQAINTSGIYQQIFRMTSEDVFISMSFPRYSQSTVNATMFAKQCGANVVAITDSAASPLAPYADQLLTARSDMASFADSLVAPLSLLNAMIVALGAKNRESLERSFGKLEQLWEENKAYKKDI